MKGTKLRFDADEKPERTLTAWSFDRGTGILRGQRQVEGERYGNGDRVYKLTFDETMETPPDVPDGSVAVFLERTRTWVTVSDHRGETWFDHMGRPQLIGRVGDPTEWGFHRREDPDI